MRRDRGGTRWPGRRAVVGSCLLLQLAFLLVVPARAASRAGGADWITQGYDIGRSGDNPKESILRPTTVAGLHLLWSFDTASGILAQPVTADAVLIHGTPTEVVYVTAKNGLVYALDAETGGLLWSQSIGTGPRPCPGSRIGPDDTPTLDVSTNRLYVAGGDNNLYALDMSTGAVISGYPVSLSTNPNEHVFSGINLFRGRIYVAIAAICSDQPPYHGRVVMLESTDPSRSKAWYVTGATGPDGGGIWSPGGVTIDRTNAEVYTATGNALDPNEGYLFAEHVVRLTSLLHVVAANDPEPVGGNDLDFGSTPVLYQPPGCPTQLAVKNKDGELFVYGRDAIDAGPSQRIQVAKPDFELFMGDVAYSPRLNMMYLGNSDDSPDGTYTHGMVAFRVQQDCTLALAWQQAVGVDPDVTPSPTVAGRVVYYADGIGNQVIAFDASTGAQLWTSGSTIEGPVYQAPTVVNGHLFVGALDGKLYEFGL